MKFLKTALIFIITASFATTSFAFENWNSKEGRTRFENSKFKNDFYQLVNFYQPQINPLYCAAATGVMLLGAFHYGNIPSTKSGEVEKPKALGGGNIEFREYLQTDFFNEKTDKIKKRDIINLKEPKSIIDGKENYDPGLSLEEFAKILSKSYGLKVTTRHIENVTDSAIASFRELLKKVLNDDKSFIVVNFDGKVLGQKTNGHISPLAAYDETSDSALVLDVALHKNTWYWVSVTDLMKAMNTKDGEQYRGYLIVKK